MFLDFIKEGLPVLREQVPARQNATLKRDVEKPASQQGPMAFSPVQPLPAADETTELDRQIAEAKRDAIRDLERTAAYQRMSPTEQAKARSSAVSRVSSRFTAARRGAAGEMLNSPQPASSRAPRSLTGRTGR